MMGHSLSMAVVSFRRFGIDIQRQRRADTVTRLKGDGYSLFVFRSEGAVFVVVNNDEWKGR